MEKKLPIIGIIGHVDHGKSTLTAAICNALKNTYDVILVDNKTQTIEAKTLEQIMTESKIATFECKNYQIPDLAVADYAPKYEPKKQQNYKPYKNKFTKGKR